MRSVIKTMFEDYAYNLDKSMEQSGFPITLRNLKLKEKRVNEDLEDTPFELTSGTIGSVSLDAGWMGSLTVVATGVKLELSFNPGKAAKLLMAKGQEVPDDDIFLTGQAAPEPPPNVPPRFCTDHDTSAKRPKGDPYWQTCECCGMSMQTSYLGVKLCPPCSEKNQKCMICNKPAGRAGNYMPPSVLGGKPLMGSSDMGAPPGQSPPGQPQGESMQQKRDNRSRPGRPPGEAMQQNRQGQFPPSPSNGTLPPSASNYGVGVPPSAGNHGPGNHGPGAPGSPPRAGYPGGPQGGPPQRRPPGPGGPGGRPPARRPPPQEEDDDLSITGFFKWITGGEGGGGCGNSPGDSQYEMQVAGRQQRPPPPNQMAYRR